MIIFRSTENITGDFRGSFVSIGNFDGVHLSHQFICRKLASEAKQAGTKSLVITFDPHPKMILHPNIRPFFLITTLDEKLERLAACGIDGVLVIPFTMEYSKTTAEEFVHNFLGRKLAIGKIIIGHDYTFGQGKKGNSDYLIAAGRDMGFAVEVVDAVKSGNDIISSTLIRKSIIEGNLKKAAVLLGRYYNVAGKVVTGFGRGVTLGFPTANIEPEKELLPPPGIYAAFVDAEEKRYQAVLNIGAKPTFEDYTFSFEVHLLDFSGDLRGKRINTDFVEKLRDIVKFDSPETLKKQIAADVEKAKTILLENISNRQGT
ncbi:MAG TPA: bifunctional riboflavin kinase/FAD synthetase [Smithella sp.]|jgi:riboflavin kinase/FMN adenylyltransferase|nr:MAG: Riboflavin biosynthesis protein RibF [Deltaproteobacteria bacterium ADurb.Bin022]HNQ65171.1 bifunctional riboflavin kinase/FAD synthetase [Smithella sp.]HOE33105.1 bifunctional riboflavin kinase/FAD synthetase [Smithella sp.]HOO35370.1 bifunctional riboflavin kinase/FAD synthetase [Smithella sp.]HOX98779.1 bifunctional riboflavin kinase/FAD synthetase [Smithella sp.]